MSVLREFKSRTMAVMKSVLLTKLAAIFTYFSPVTTVLLTILTVYFVAFKWRRRRMEYLLDKLPGPMAIPIFGNMLEISTGFEGVFRVILCNTESFISS